MSNESINMLSALVSAGAGVIGTIAGVIAAIAGVLALKAPRVSHSSVSPSPTPPTTPSTTPLPHVNPEPQPNVLLAPSAPQRIYVASAQQAETPAITSLPLIIKAFLLFAAAACPLALFAYLIRTPWVLASPLRDWVSGVLIYFVILLPLFAIHRVLCGPRGKARTNQNIKVLIDSLATVIAVVMTLIGSLVAMLPLRLVFFIVDSPIIRENSAVIAGVLAHTFYFVVLLLDLRVVDREYKQMA